MIEVHPPDHRIGGFRDFAIHILTITIGLLIALSLEGCVEWYHHRELRHEALARMHDEIAANKKDLNDALSHIPKEIEALETMNGFLTAPDPAQMHGKTSQLGYRLATVGDASWKTAAATGAAALIPYEQVQRYAAAYQLQSDFSTLQMETLTGFLDLQSHIAMGQDPSKLSRDEAAAAAREARRIIAHMRALQDIGRSLNITYDDALKAE